MKTKAQTPNRTGRLLTLAAALVALAVLPARAQTTEEFKQLKTIVEQMQKTIDAQNARIAELEKSRAGQPATNPPAAVAPVATAAASPPRPHPRQGRRWAAGRLPKPRDLPRRHE